MNVEQSEQILMASVECGIKFCFEALFKLLFELESAATTIINVKLKHIALLILRENCKSVVLRRMYIFYTPFSLQFAEITLLKIRISHSVLHFLHSFIGAVPSW